MCPVLWKERDNQYPCEHPCYIWYIKNKNQLIFIYEFLKIVLLWLIIFTCHLGCDVLVFSHFKVTALRCRGTRTCLRCLYFRKGISGTHFLFNVTGSYGTFPFPIDFRYTLYLCLYISVPHALWVCLFCFIFFYIVIIGLDVVKLSLVFFFFCWAFKRKKERKKYIKILDVKQTNKNQ